MAITANKEKGILKAKTRSEDQYSDSEDDVTRIKNMKGRWIFKKVGNNQLSVVYEVESPVPDYLPDAVAEEIFQTGPFETLKNLQKIIRKSKYRKAEPDWL